MGSEFAIFSWSAAAMTPLWLYAEHFGVQAKAPPLAAHSIAASPQAKAPPLAAQSIAASPQVRVAHPRRGEGGVTMIEGRGHARADDVFRVDRREPAHIRRGGWMGHPKQVVNGRQTNGYY